MFIAAWLAATTVLAQEPDDQKDEPEPKKVELPKRELPADTKLSKTVLATIRGASVPYRVTTGTQPVYGEDGGTIAALHYTYYERTDVAEELRRAMAQNPYLKVMVQSGFYDGATNYFTAKYVLWNLDRSGRLTDRMRFEGYESGHMMYLRNEDLALSNQHIREFIEATTPAEGEAASYGSVGDPGQ